MSKKSVNKVLRGLVYILPAVLFFSYEPVIALGGNESMNFEFSLPLLWLVVFDVVSVVEMVRRKVLWKGLKGKWLWVLFPLWLSLSILWSQNKVRGVLTVGILWLIYLAVYGIWSLREEFDLEFKRKWWKWFFGSALFVCAVCVVQCVLDLVGVGRDYSLICQGCTYSMFGFPHPDGFAIEPQFMGNLLLAPTLVAMWLIVCGGRSNAFWGRGPRARLYGARPLVVSVATSETPQKASLPTATINKPTNVPRWYSLVAILSCFLVFSATLFLTFSRGAIYAFVVAMVVMSIWVVVSEKKKRKIVAKRVGMAWGVVVLAFLLVLNFQGVMAEVSPTNDTYRDGVAKVVEQLTLGVVKLKDGETGEDSAQVDEIEEGDDGKEEAVFDGYVAESTDTRVRLAGAAVKVWGQDFKTAAFGVGIGGAGQALFENDLSPAPKEIVQNQYASLLMETGVIGVLLLVLTLGLVIRALWRNVARMMLVCLVLAYGLSLLFFSGLPNALHIYLMPAILYIVLEQKKIFAKKV